MNLRWGQNLRTVEYVERELNLRNFSQRLTEKRVRFPILVIDDEEFTPIDFLRRHKYNITHIPDAPNIDVATSYPIVLCDIVGVGRSLSPNNHGAQLIAEIKKSFPEKIVIAYTGGATSPLLELSIQSADRYLKKDAPVEEWCQILDDAILELANPAAVWKKFRHRLLRAGASPYQLAVLEDAFATHVLAGRETYEPQLLGQAKRINLPPAAKSIVLNLIASAVFEFGKAMLH